MRGIIGENKHVITEASEYKIAAKEYYEKLYFNENKKDEVK